MSRFTARLVTAFVSCLSLAISPFGAAQTCVQFPTRNILNPATHLPGYPAWCVESAGDSLLVAIAEDPALGNVVWIMDLVGEEWVQKESLAAWDGAPGFGHAIAVHNQVALIGGSERVYVFRQQDGQWKPEQILVPTDGTLGDWFGEALDVSGDYAIIGAPFDDEPGFVDRGSAYIFHYDGAQWHLQRKLTPGTVPSNTNFGHEVAIDGDVIAITEGSKCRIFEPIVPAIWNETTAFNGYGGDVQFHNNQLFAGGSGGVGIFEEIDGAWMQVGLVTASDHEVGDAFGLDIAIDAERMIVTAPMKDEGIDPTGPLLGAAYVFVNTPSGWKEDRKLLTSLYGGLQENIGQSVIIVNDRAVFADPNKMWLFDATLLGSVFEFSLAECSEPQPSKRCAAVDCDGSGVADDCEIASGAAADCNINGVPDHCEQRLLYQIDDGTAEMAYGYQGPPSPGADVVALNRFKAVPGGEFVDVVSFPWSIYYNAGLPVNIVVYDDPNNDGIPDDAVLLSSTDIMSGYDDQAPEDSQLRNTYQIARTFVGSPGESFFVGVNLWIGAESYPITVDSTGSAQTDSWFIAELWPAEHSNLGDYQVMQHFPGGERLMIRAGTLDCNGNGTWDSCDISSGASLDANGNGTPDECEIFDCVSDIAPEGGNGIVDTDDLLQVINNWGAVGSNVADITGDENVDTDDLLAVINAWGVCE